MIGPKDPYTTKVVQSSRDKMVVRRAAHSIVSVSYIMDGRITDKISKLRPICSSLNMTSYLSLQMGGGHHDALASSLNNYLILGNIVLL
jgi:hypothetical protein